ncbi:transcriptional regulator GlxA family with amidase domain [Pseudomonas sp. JUb42]|jgi:transcriptional regulator GlxA family with amidase domain|uniref:GlxA family transcriptional regulator n=1 Tax=Pseudomonas sp. JUb42 TaxID=2940611 RepID=UPI00216A57CC|nr:helix-turn-helix domain-containing protein [Pseudomonas sp. JUb42]MCS3468903.1 transcriptional regulator GlxA family with amidase domain [Pseudomonas sp. JUb42]
MISSLVLTKSKNKSYDHGSSGAIAANDNFGIIYAMRIAVLVLEGVFDTGLTAVLDAFSTANELGGLLLEQYSPFEVSIIGVRRKVLTAQGMRVPLAAAADLEAFDWVILPALSAKMPDQLLPALSRRDVQDALIQLRKWNEGGTRIAAACIGTFLLAEAGLLDGQEATTTWWLGPFFRQRYPKVRLDESRMLVPSGCFVTAGAAMGHLDLALWLMNQISPEVAALVARYMIIDERPSQAPYMIPDHLARADPLVERFERWARERLAEGFSLQAASEALSTSKRTLQRRIEAVLGKSPLSYFQDLRVERAQHLVRTSALDIEAIATQVGYADGATLRSLLRRRLGRGVRELRAS